MTATTRKYLTVAEAAEYVGFSTKTIFRRIQSGELRALRSGRQYRIHVDDLEAMLAPVKVWAE